MKKTDYLTRVVTGILLLALICYLGFYVADAVFNPFRSTLAVRMTVQEGFTVSGIVIRRETVIESGGYDAVNIVVSEGERVAVGGTVAGVYGDESTLLKIREIDALDARIERLEAVLKAGTAATDMLTLDSDIKSGIYKLVAAARGRSLSDISDITTELEANILARTVGDDELRAKLLSLRQQRLALGTVGTLASKITAPVSGLFTSNVDGFESVGEDSLKGFTVDSLTSLMSESRTAPPGAIGKLVSGVKWYYAAVLNTEDAARLSDGGTATMIFGRYQGAGIQMDIESIGPPENGKCVVIFSSDNAMAETLSIRFQSVEIVHSEYSGIRVPKSAVCLNSRGEACVYTLTGAMAEEKKITILYELDDFYIVESSEEVTSLHVGDEIITSTRDIYDGKMVR